MISASLTDVGTTVLKARSKSHHATGSTRLYSSLSLSTPSRLSIHLRAANFRASSQRPPPCSLCDNSAPLKPSVNVTSLSIETSSASGTFFNADEMISFRASASGRSTYTDALIRPLRVIALSISHGRFVASKTNSWFLLSGLNPSSSTRNCSTMQTF